jgi:glycerol-3-phosphate dehydrogenase (NAD(P)+)
MPIRFAILGAGAWGTALAVHLAKDPEHRVCLWSARPENARLLVEKRENVRLLPGVPIPPSVVLTSDAAEAAADANLVLVAIPTAFLRATLQRVRSALPVDTPVLSLVKGLEIDTFLRPTEIVRQVLGSRHVAVLSGPSHAEEVSRGMPTSLVVASTDLELARWIQERVSGERVRVYTNPDVIGVELAGALKNIIGIAAGIGDGLGFGDNAKSALVTRGLVEMTRFGVALGAEPRTFYGLAGMGDLITTCFSPHGRNCYVGECLARGETLTDLQQRMTMIAEGIYTTRSVYEKSTKMGIDMPITTEVYCVLYERKDPSAAVNDLMLRESTSEQ